VRLSETRPWWKPERVHDEGCWIACVICIILIFPVGAYFFGTATTYTDPSPRYNIYVEVERDGFVLVHFFFARDIDERMNQFTLEQEGNVSLTDSWVLDGWYYRYDVVYLNGTILSTEKEYISYGVNRTLVSFDSVILRILHVFKGYGPSAQERKDEIGPLTISGLGVFVLVVFSFAMYMDAGKPYYRRRRGWR